MALDVNATRCSIVKRVWLDATQAYNYTDIPPDSPSGFYDIYCCRDGTAYGKHGNYTVPIYNPELFCPREGGGGPYSFVNDGGGGLDWTSVASFFAPTDQQGAVGSLDIFNSSPPPSLTLGAAPNAVQSQPALSGMSGETLLLLGGGLLVLVLLSR